MVADPKLVRDHFLAVAELPATERGAYLSARCGETEMRAAVERLLAAHEAPASAVNPPDHGLPTADYVAITERPGTMIGPYKLMEQIGEGGFGLVFVAEQQEPVRRKVALKVIKPGMDTRELLARFTAERQALALMDHPNIARVLDAGATESGRPYFVMELVRGIPITEYCDKNHLSPRERLELFVTVCQAVQHAHQKGIIHRDIKPSNVLVTSHDGKPVAKVIDFGVAKAIGSQLTERTVYTKFSQMIGTPSYMSPEQAEMSGLDIDTRSDIYSLGVLLYELLTGTTPLDKKRFAKAAYDEIRRMIREDEPQKPSTRLSTSASIVSIAAQRHTEPAKLSKLMRGDLDWITMKALEKDRTRRYETATGLAKDIERYFRDEPVEACPPTLGYKVRKAVRKYKQPLAVAGAFAALLLAGLGLVTWKWQDERAARTEADVARYEAETNARKIQKDAEALNAANAAIDLGAQQSHRGDWPTAEAAHTKAIQLREEHSSAWLRRGDMYGEIGLWDRMAADYERAFAIREPDTAQLWYYQALLRLAMNDETGYRRVCRRMLELFGDTPVLYAGIYLTRACSLAPGTVVNSARVLQHAERTQPRLNVDYRWVGWYITGLAYYRIGRYDDAIVLLREALDSTTYHARALNYPVLAMALHRAGQPDAARQELANARKVYDQWTENASGRQNRDVPTKAWYDWLEFQVLYREAHQVIENSPLPADPRQQIIRGRSLAALERQAEADAEYDAALRMAPEDARVRFACFWRHVEQGRLVQADAELNKVLALRPNDSLVHTAAFSVYADNGLLDKAVAEHDRAVALRPDACPILSKDMGQRIWSRIAVKSFAEAENLARGCLASREKALPDNWGTFNTKVLLGAALSGQKKYAEAEPLLVTGFEGMKLREKQMAPSEKFLLTEAAERLVRHFEAQDKAEEAAKWKKELAALRGGK